MQQPQTITPLNRFLATCSYLPETAPGLLHQRQVLECLSATPLEPKALWDGIHRHRIFALAQEVLRTHSMAHLLGKLQPALALRAKQCRLDSLRLSVEADHVSALLSGLRLQHRFLKGPRLSKKIYGDPTLRHSKDLDLIVRPQDMCAALDVLQSEGWQPLRHHGMWLRSGLYRWIAERRLRHFELVHRNSKVMLELHWQFEQAHVPALEKIWWTEWPCNNSQVSPAEFLHLCLHGSSHAWMRSKWLGDIQAILDRQPTLWAESRPLSRQLGLDQALAQTILLLQILFHTEPDQAARQLLNSQPQARELAAFALKSMQRELAATKLSRRASIEYRHYMFQFANRLGYAARSANLLGLCFVDAKDLEAWNRSALLLPAIPLIRASKLLNRYCFNQAS